MPDNVIPFARQQISTTSSEEALRLENQLLRAWLDQINPGWRENLSEALEARYEALERSL